MQMCRLNSSCEEINLHSFYFTVQKIQEEGKHAIDSPGSPSQFDIPPEDYALRKYWFIFQFQGRFYLFTLLNSSGDHEQRAVIDPQSINDPEVLKLQQILIDWINDELAEQRIIVQSIDEDMYDGQVLHKLWEKLTGKKLDVLEVTQSEEGQRQKLNIVLNAVNHVNSFHFLSLKSYELRYISLPHFSDARISPKNPQMVRRKCPL